KQAELSQFLRTGAHWKSIALRCWFHLISTS
ncbi:unnamed protein product, partial [Rotaria magnacalcarata]